MTDLYLVRDDAGKALDARFHLEGADIVLHSRGGAKATGAVNADYSRALLLLIKRLAVAKVDIVGAWVDSTVVQALPPAKRVILEQADATKGPEQIVAQMSLRMKEVRNSKLAAPKGGNSTKRIRITTNFKGRNADLAEVVGGQGVSGDYSSENRLPADVLRLATPEYVWHAVDELAAGGSYDPFGPSTDYDLITDDGLRLPPKAVFGRALSMALGGAKVFPKNFTSGSTCFQLLRDAGYQIVPKDSPGGAPSSDPELDSDPSWSEGKKKVVAHFKRERGAGLSRAKKAQFRRLHGKLTCERCNEDPVVPYGSEHAEACIEVHHAAKQVSDMLEEHQTKLSDLQCLCANCHRLVHRQMRVGLAQ